MRAPYKEVIWFDESAHTPDLDEPEMFQEEEMRIGEQVCSQSQRKEDATLAGTPS